MLISSRDIFHLGIAHYEHKWDVIVVLHIILECKFTVKQFSTYLSSRGNLWFCCILPLWMESSCAVTRLASLESQFLFFCYFYSGLYCAATEEFKNQGTKIVFSTLQGLALVSVLRVAEGTCLIAGCWSLQPSFCHRVRSLSVCLCK